MRNVTYFPPYTQRENVVTNAVLVLFSQVNRLSPDIFSRLLVSLTDVEKIKDFGPTFYNQVGSEGQSGYGKPDALIKQEPFQLYIETKLGNNLDFDQVNNHFKTINDKYNHRNGILLAITKYPLNGISHLGKIEEEYSKRFFHTTFTEIVDILRNETDNFRVELNALLSEFEVFLLEQGLLHDLDKKMLVNPCSISYELNKDYNIYYDQPHRSKVICKYLGLYNKKCVSQIGEVIHVTTATIGSNAEPVLGEPIKLDWRSSPGLSDDIIIKKLKEVASHEVMSENINKELRFYFVKEFVKINYMKTSAHGIQGHRYFTLGGTEGVLTNLFENNSPSIEEIAAGLNGLNWE